MYAAVPSIARHDEERELGKPGHQRERDEHRRPRRPAAAHRDSNWLATSSPRLDSEAARVVMRPPDIDTSSAGIAVTRPSPTVSSV